MGLASGINPYVYVNNAPTMYVDPTGEIPIAAPVLGLLGGLVAGAIINNMSKPGKSGSAEDDPLGGAAGSSAGAGTKSGQQNCPDDDGDDCKQKASDWELKQAGIDAHEVKKGLGQVSLFEICKCKSGGFAVKRKGCKGPIIFRL